MSKVTHLVVAIDHSTGRVSFDGDASRLWIRQLFQPGTNTYDLESGEFVAPDLTLEREALDLLMGLGVEVDGTFHDWQED